MAELVSHLLSKYGHLSLIPKTHVKKQNDVCNCGAG